MKPSRLRQKAKRKKQPTRRRLERKKKRRRKQRVRARRERKKLLDFFLATKSSVIPGILNVSLKDIYDSTLFFLGNDCDL